MSVIAVLQGSAVSDLASSRASPLPQGPVVYTRICGVHTTPCGSGLAREEAISYSTNAHAVISHLYPPPLQLRPLGRGRPGQRHGWPGGQSAVGEIHRHFEANAQIGKRGFSPHGSILFLCRTIPVRPLMHGVRGDRMLLSKEVAACVGRGCSGVSDTAIRGQASLLQITCTCRSEACPRKPSHGFVSNQKNPSGLMS